MAPSGELPVVDLAPFFTEDGKGGGIAGATEAMRQACQTHGFFRAVNHGMPAHLMARALELSAAFFARPVEEKAKVRAAQGSKVPAPAGYGQQPAHVPDKNEYLLVFDQKLGLNAYPDEPSGFRETVEECYSKLTELGLLIQNILNDSMGLPTGFLKGYNDDRGFDLMIVRRYLPATTEEDSVGFSVHEDASCFTFIFQDDVGGLEVLTDDGHWIPAEPVGGSIIVNIGDVIQVLSNNKLKSATHRVVRRPVHRHSFSFFFNPPGDKWVEPLPEFTAKIGEMPRYRGFVYKEYQQLRTRNKTHPPPRLEDVVNNISHYAIY